MKVYNVVRFAKGEETRILATYKNKADAEKQRRAGNRYAQSSARGVTFAVVTKTVK